MKLRIRGNSIRLRVTRAELATVAQDGELRDVVIFGPGVELGYALKIAGAGKGLSADLSDREITIFVPESRAREWLDTELVSLRGEQDLDNGDSLKILVEKDFACLVPREGEDDSDAFPHPEAETGESC